MESRRSFTPLAWLILADLFLIGVHLVHGQIPLLDRRGLSMTREGGLAEHFQYAKELWIALVFLGLAVRRRDRWYMVWAWAFAYLMLDDSLKIHERGGKRIAAAFGFPEVFGLRTVDLGEITVMLATGGTLVAFLVVAYVRGTPPLRRISRNLVAMLALLAVCGVLVDMANVIAYGTPYELPTLLLEDGGEMLVMSGIAYSAWRLAAAEFGLAFVPGPSAGAAGAEARAPADPAPAEGGRRAT